MAQILTKKQVLILLGAPGCGKGSQAMLLKEKLGVPHISTGDILRENIKQGTELGRQAKSFMDAGNLVPDSLIVNILLNRIAKEDCEKGYILDGFPRTLSQAKILEEQLGDEVEILALHLDASTETVLKRILGRLICKSCQTPYHLTFSLPKTEGVCDKCNSPLYQRKDDSEKIALERLNVYAKQTAPLLQFFKERNRLHTISCEQSKQEVFVELIKLTR